MTFLFISPTKVGSSMQTYLLAIFISLVFFILNLSLKKHFRSAFNRHAETKQNNKLYQETLEKPD